MTTMETRAVTLWRAGNDTAAIAEELDTDEAWVSCVIAADQDRRHALRQREAQRA